MAMFPGMSNGNGRICRIHYRQEVLSRKPSKTLLFSINSCVDVDVSRQTNFKQKENFELEQIYSSFTFWWQGSSPGPALTRNTLHSSTYPGLLAARSEDQFRFQHPCQMVHSCLCLQPRGHLMSICPHKDIHTFLKSTLYLPFLIVLIFCYLSLTQTHTDSKGTREMIQ